MMKKIFALVLLLVLGKMSYSQYPIQQNLGSDSTIVISKGALQSRLINVTYTDTAQANTQRIRQYPGAQIATTSGGINLWIRNATATGWLPINTGSGNNIYTIDGTLTGNRTLSGNGGYSLTFTGLSQFLLSVGNQTFTVRSDSASLTRKLSYASNRGSTFTLYSLVDKNYVDSAIASSPAGTVTQINTNNNTGITGGPITSTGTLAIDTLLISTRAWRQKGVDSLQANINLKLNIVDTTGMLANYVNSVGYGLGKTSQTVYVDSASLSNYYLRRKDSLTTTNPLGYVTKKVLADTAAAIRSSDLGGTVTSVATNNGTGITGGTITTSGTLAIDTTVISTRAWRQKGVDSLQANINLKLNISDTASMLSPYLRSNTAAATYVPQTRTITINGNTQDLTANRTYNVGTVTSVGLTMPAAFNVANSPVTGSGTLAVTGAGLASQYIRGDGTLANFPGGGGGGGASVSYYLNGSVNQGTFGGNTYYQMNKTPILGGGTNFTINTNGYIAQFITNAGDPALLNIPAGNWNFELFFSASSGGGTPSYYVELYKYDGTTFTLIASGSSNPDVIVNSAVDAYFSALPVPQTTLTLTDRLAVRIYVTPAGRTITLHTEDNNLCQVVTTFTTGITAINSLTAQVQYLTTGTSGTDFNISSLTDTHTFNLPVASGTNTGKLSNTDWTTFNNKVGGSLVNGYITKATGTNTIDTSQLFQSNGLIGIGTTSPTQKLQVSGNAYVNGQLFAGDTALSVYQVEGILNTPYVLGRKAVNNTLSTEARPTGVMGHVVGRGSIANRLQAANFYTTTDSASTANSTGSLRSVNAWTAHNGSGSLATAWGSYNIVQNKTTGTITNAYGSVSGVENRGATSTINKLHGTTTEIWNNYGGTIDTAFGQVISIYNNNAASNIGAVYGLSIGKGLITPTGGTHYWRNSGTIGTSYGLYLDSSIDVGTTKYALFSNSNSNSYFRAKLGIGTTSPDSAFQVATGAYFQRGIRASGLPQAAGTKALRIDASGTISYADTLIDAGGTVTSVATNNGTGITGGTITTSGTLAIDTLRISTRAWRQKGVDSVAALANTKVSGSLISGYIPKATGTLTVDTSQIYQNNGNIGIGTISPASGFKVDMTGSLRVGNGSSYNNITINGSGAVGSYLRFQKNGTNKGDIGPYSAVLGGVPPYSGSNDDLTYSSVGGHFFNTNAGIKMYLNNAGNLGLSTSPDSMLTVLEGAYFQRGVRMSGLPSAPGTRALRINANGTLSVADTLVDAGGTVTSVATNNGTGITGGTITTTGTLAIDTLRISTRAWRQKGIDSVAALINSNVSGTTNYVAKFTGTNTIGNSQLFDNGTNVGIGTTSPTAKLEVTSSSLPTIISNTGTGGVYQSVLSLRSTSPSYGAGIQFYDGTNDGYISWYNQGLYFAGTGGATRMLINSSGNVGIGTTSPAYKLQAVVDNSYSTLVIAASSLNGNVTGGLTFGGIYNSDDLNFYSGGSFTEKMRIKSSGLVGIGTGSPAYNLHISSASNETGIGLTSTATGGRTYRIFTNPAWGAGSLQIYDATADVSRISIFSNGNVAINSITDAGYRLDVNGIVRATGETIVSGGTFYLNNTDNSQAAYLVSTGTGGSAPLIIATNSTERMRITSSGVVGIGTSSPVGLFEVKGDGVSYFTRGTKSILLNPNVVGGDVNALIETSTGMALAFGTNGSERMRLDASGNLGLGTSSINAIGSSTVFQINGTTGNSAFQLFSVAGTLRGAMYANASEASVGSISSIPLLFKTNDTERMRLDASGNLGLGTSSPSTLLDVAGAIRTSSTGLLASVRINNSTASTGKDWHLYSLNNGNFGLYNNSDGSYAYQITPSGNLGLGVTPSAWASGFTALQVKNASLWSTGSDASITANAYYDGSNYRYIASSASSRTYHNTDGSISWHQAGSGTAGNAISFTQAMTLDASGRLGIGSTSPASVLHIENSTPTFTIRNTVNASVSQGAANNLSAGLINFGANGSYNVVGSIESKFGSDASFGRIADLIFSTRDVSNLTERMRITSGGLLLVNGTTNYYNYQAQVNGAIYSYSSAQDRGIVIYPIQSTPNIQGVIPSSGNVGNIALNASGGNVGIGTTSPGYKLEVNGDIGFSGGASLKWGGNTYIYGSNNIQLEARVNGNLGWYINSSGNVGIGTTSPASLLNVLSTKTTALSTAADFLTLGATIDDNTDYANVGIGGGIAFRAKRNAGGTQTVYGAIDAAKETALGDEYRGSLRFWTNQNATGVPLERMRITSGGNVGIGTTSPATKFEVAGSGSIGYFRNPSSTTATTYITVINANNTSNGLVMAHMADGTGYFGTQNSAALRFVTNDAEKMRITSGGNVFIGTTTYPASEKLGVAGTISVSDGSYPYINLRLSGSNSVFESVGAYQNAVFGAEGSSGNTIFKAGASERMRLTSGGDLLIATTTDAGAYPLQVNGSVYATAYYESSDLRLKNVLSERQGSDGINTITFKWKDGRDSLTHIGYAAQQVEKVLPDAVKTNTDGYKTINYDEVQSLKIANLEQEIAELKKIIKQLIDKK